MKIYILHDNDSFNPIGYYVNKDLACKAAEEHWYETGDISEGFPRYWNEVCVLEEVTVVTEIEE